MSEAEEKEAMPKVENLLLPLEEMLAAGLHIGTRIKTGDMEQYIYRVRPDGLFILNIGKTDEKIRLAAKFIAQFEPDRVLAVSSRIYGKTPIEKFSELTRTTLMVGRFMPNGVFRICPPAEKFWNSWICPMALMAAMGTAT